MLGGGRIEQKRKGTMDMDDSVAIVGLGVSIRGLNSNGENIINN